MKIEPGNRFRLELTDQLKSRLNRKGWTGSQQGFIEKIEDDHISVRFSCGQPWIFERNDFTVAAVADDGPPWDPIEE